MVSIGAEDECWPWTGFINDDGYGEFHFQGQMVGAHELAVSFTTGEKRAAVLDTCHSCNNPPSAATPRICASIPDYLTFRT